MSKQQELLAAVKRNDSWDVRRFINSNTDLDFVGAVDSKASTVLHLASHNNNTELVQLFLQLYDEKAKADPQEYNQERKRTWMNLKDFDGFGCIHYAVFRANYKMALIVEHHGADIYQINSLGLCVMHIAAQGDSPLLLYYFMNKGFKIQVEDSKGSTPLHWACYSGSESSVNALLAWGSEIDCQDKIYGLTPLHLAVLSGNGRIVRKLLIRGANRTIQDFRGKLPLELAKQNEYSNIASMIEDSYGCAEFYNLKQPYRKTTGCSGPFIVLLGLYISTFLLNCIFVVHHMSLPLNLTFLSVSVLPALLLVFAACTDPGRLKNKTPSPKNLFQIMGKNEADRVCYDCEIVKPTRSRHCDVCGSCIMVYDHHCPWINNCVGAKNYCSFYLFIVMMDVNLVFTLCYEIYSLVHVVTWYALDFWQIIHIVVASYTLLTCIFCIPLTVLIFVQCQNCCKDQTTFQRFGGGKTSSESSMKKSEEVALGEDREMRRDSDTSNRPTSHRQSSNSLSIEEPLLHADSKQIVDTKPSGNCLDMCFRNRSNSTYMV